MNSDGIKGSPYSGSVDPTGALRGKNTFNLPMGHRNLRYDNTNANDIARIGQHHWIAWTLIAGNNQLPPDGGWTEWAITNLDRGEGATRAAVEYLIFFMTSRPNSKVLCLGQNAVLNNMVASTDRFSVINIFAGMDPAIGSTRFMAKNLIMIDNGSSVQFKTTDDISLSYMPYNSTYDLVVIDGLLNTIDSLNAKNSARTLTEYVRILRRNNNGVKLVYSVERFLSKHVQEW